MDIQIDDIIIRVIMFFIPFLFALCFHEFAHGWMARRFGDNTAEVMGRLTLNPMAHADPIGTFALPLFAIVVPGMPLFGWAKPVPVNPRNLDRPKQDMFWIALAGPLSNMLLFVIGLAVFAVVYHQMFFIPSNNLLSMILMFLRLNLYLAFFNLLPMHPLDGGKVIARFLPPKWDLWLEEKQGILQMVLLLMVIFGVLGILALPVEWIVRESVGLVQSL